MRPLLAVHEDGIEHEIAVTRELLADQFGLSEEDRATRIPSGRVTTLQNRVGWAATYLFRTGLLERPKRAHYRITDRGRTVLAEHPERVDLTVLKQFEELDEFRRGEPSAKSSASAPEQLTTEVATAEERIDAGYEELHAALAADLLDRVREGTWEFFEQLVLKVLKAMGYGGPEGAVERLGGHGGDEGVDGVIREDTLGLDLIYVQAKSWENTVGRPEIQRFFGALHGKRAGKGIFITTSKFSAEARDYAEGVTPRVILVDGRQLAELMIEHDVGVTTLQTFELKRVNLDYFAAADEGGSPSA
jgi:restriction system protein